MASLLFRRAIKPVVDSLRLATKTSPSALCYSSGFETRYAQMPNPFANTFAPYFLLNPSVRKFSCFSNYQAPTVPKPFSPFSSLTPCILVSRHFSTKSEAETKSTPTKSEAETKSTPTKSEAETKSTPTKSEAETKSTPIKNALDDKWLHGLDLVSKAIIEMECKSPSMLAVASKAWEAAKAGHDKEKYFDEEKFEYKEQEIVARRAWDLAEQPLFQTTLNKLLREGFK